MSYNDLQILQQHIHQLLDGRPRSPIIQLPPELRNILFAKVIIAHLNAIGPQDRRDRRTIAHYMPPLFQTCRQLRSEGLSLLYGTFIRVTPCFSTKPKDYTIPEIKKMALKPIKNPGYAQLCQSSGRKQCYMDVKRRYPGRRMCIVYRSIDAKNTKNSSRYYISEISDQQISGI